MATGQSLRGFVGQGMSGRRKSPTSYAYSYPVGSYTWTCPRSGWWRFVLWGGGGGGNATVNGGGSGALYIGERYVAKGQQVAIASGAGGAPAGDGANSTVTLPDGETLTAGGGKTAGTAGAVTANRNLDIVYAGSAGGGTATNGAAGLGDAGGAGGAAFGGVGGGAGAPGYGTYRGGAGQGGAGAGASAQAGFPGAGGGAGTSSDKGGQGGGGFVLIHNIRLQI